VLADQITSRNPPHSPFVKGGSNTAQQNPISETDFVFFKWRLDGGFHGEAMK
jgi:hypothetical protein